METGIPITSGRLVNWCFQVFFCWSGGKRRCVCGEIQPSEWLQLALSTRRTVNTLRIGVVEPVSLELVSTVRASGSPDLEAVAVQTPPPFHTVADRPRGVMTAPPSSQGARRCARLSVLSRSESIRRRLPSSENKPTLMPSSLPIARTVNSAAAICFFSFAIRRSASSLPVGIRHQKH